jgi:hypothetical protein
MKLNINWKLRSELSASDREEKDLRTKDVRSISLSLNFLANDNLDQKYDHNSCI